MLITRILIIIIIITTSFFYMSLLYVLVVRGAIASHVFQWRCTNPDPHPQSFSEGHF